MSKKEGYHICVRNLFLYLCSGHPLSKHLILLRMKTFLVSLLCMFALCTTLSADEWGDARWISAPDQHADSINSWTVFRRDISLNKQPSEAIAHIAVDSKYWLWINGKLIIFEGGLKRGPSPQDTYYDEINLAPYLKKGKNQIALLVWYFGKNGFSHKSSGKSGLLFSLKAGNIQLISDSNWQCRLHPAYQTTGKPFPNYRLPESNIRFDAKADIPGWQTVDAGEYALISAKELAAAGDAPWNKLVKRPIPFWKDFGVKEVEYTRKSGEKVDTIVASFPYNLQMTPVLDITDPKGGNLVQISTDHSVAGGAINIRAEYVTKQGRQNYESLGWMNGEKLILVLPHEVIVDKLAYRETGYDTEPSGRFSCDDDFYMRFWEKGLRTIYVNMRDTYFDCPDRERAQWWGDVVLLMGECFYTYSPSVHALMYKGIHELANWQKPNGSLYAPVPSGNYDSELPGQSLASIGRYGFWNYYMNTGDEQTIRDVYLAVKKYLNIWTLDSTGLTDVRKGGWMWGDWGDNRDIRMLYAGWHYLALDAAAHMADLLDYPQDATQYRQAMEQIKKGFNLCWNGYAYRHPSYQQETDDRVQALAVICGIADESKYERILSLFKSQKHASPYMEKYVMEALFVMGQGNYGLERAKERFASMVNHPGHSTLFEGWDIGEKGFGGGTVNHAWSGGPLTVISQYLCGVAPLKPAYQLFKIEPSPASFKKASIEISTVKGIVASSFDIAEDVCTMHIVVPQKTEALLYLPVQRRSDIYINGKAVSEKQYSAKVEQKKEGKEACLLKPGKYSVNVPAGIFK